MGKYRYNHLILYDFLNLYSNLIKNYPNQSRKAIRLDWALF